MAIYIADSALLERVKFELEIDTSFVDVQGQNVINAMLTSKIEAAKGLMIQRGIQITDTAPIAETIVQYACFLYRAKAETGEMPLYLRKMMDACMFEGHLNEYAA